MLTLKKTCGACPEQYDAYDGDKYVGYLRLRHGCFRVENAAGVTVFEGSPEGDGIFNEEERDIWLNQAVAALESNAKIVNRNFEIVDESQE